MVSKSSPSKALTFPQARSLATAFKPSDNAIAARCRALAVPALAGKSAATIVEEVWSAYESAGYVLAWAFSESTIQTSLNVIRAYESLPASARKAVDKADETAILAALVGIRRTRATIPVAGRKTGVKGGAIALTSAIAALAKGKPEDWCEIATSAHTRLAKAEAADRRGTRAGKPTLAGSDEELTDAVATHNERAADARVGDEKAEKRNAKATRKSKHERDVLEPATPGNGTENLPGSGAPATPVASGKGPAKIVALADATPAQLIAALKRQVASGSVRITPALDAAMTGLVEAWAELALETHLSDVPASEAKADAATVKTGQARKSARVRAASATPSNVTPLVVATA